MTCVCPRNSPAANLPPHYDLISNISMYESPDTCIDLPDTIKKMCYIKCKICDLGCQGSLKQNNNKRPSWCREAVWDHGSCCLQRNKVVLRLRSKQQ